MKKLICLLILVSGCASLPQPEELKARPQCVIWKNGPLGTRYIAEPEGDFVKTKRACWIMDTFACTYNEYTFNKTNEIIYNGDAIATLSGRQIKVNMQGVKAAPFELGKTQASYDFQGVMGPMQHMTIEYNEPCTAKQAALGVMALIAR